MKKGQDLPTFFEHLMFGGSKHYPNFDDIVEERGGELNAFTCNDYQLLYKSSTKRVRNWFEA